MIRIDTDSFTHEVVITQAEFDGKDYVDTDEIRIPPSEQLRFLESVTRNVGYAISDTARAIALGDCETCGNRRLIQDPTKDRPWDIHCPDCSPDGPRITPFEEYPQMRRGGQ